MGVLFEKHFKRIASYKAMHILALAFAVFASGIITSGCGPGLYYEHRRPARAVEKRQRETHTPGISEAPLSESTDPFYNFYARSYSQDDYIDPARYSPAQHRRLATRNIFGRSVEGRPLEYHRYGSGEEVALVFGAIHGDEPASKTLALGLIEWLEHNSSRLSGISVVVAPAVNPDGLAANSRFNANGVDLNRNFPAENRVNSERFGLRGFSEPESRALTELMNKYPPARIISIHQPLACIDYDGPSRDMAEAMASVCDLPVRKLGAMPGSFGSYAGVERNIPVVTLELRRGDERYSRGDLWKMYGEAVLVGAAYGTGVELGSSFRSSQ